MTLGLPWKVVISVQRKSSTLAQGYNWKNYHNKRKISMGGWSGCGQVQVQIWKKEGERNEHCQKFWHVILSACNAVVMLKIETRPGCPRTNSCGSAQEMNKKKKITSRLWQGLNFTVNVNFWFCNKLMISIKTWSQKTWFLLFFHDVKTRHFCSCPNSKGDILQKVLTFLQLLDIPIWRTFYAILTTDS